MRALRRGLIVATLIVGLLVTMIPAAHAEDTCMPQVDPHHIVGDVVDCARTILAPLINWPPINLPPTG